jgi:hypothetical protein
MESKQQLLAAARVELERWEMLLGGLAVAQLTEPIDDEGWSIKDHVAHLHAWQQRSIARLEAAVLEREPAFPAWPPTLDPEVEEEPDDLNAWLHAQCRSQQWPEVHQAWRDGFQCLLNLAERLPEDALLDAGRYSWLEGYSPGQILSFSAEHHAEHREMLRQRFAQPGE